MSMETLIIDDDKIICFLHKKLCDRSGIDAVRIFTDAEEALGYLKASDGEGKQFLILLDINMPVMNGWELLDAIEGAELTTEPEVVMVTSSIDDADLERSRNYKLVKGFVSKPLNMEKLEFINRRDSFLKIV